MSASRGHNVNDGLPKVLASLHYVSVTACILLSGRGSFLGKMMRNKLIWIFQHTKMIALYWEWNGKERFTLTSHYSLDWDWHPLFSQQWQIGYRGQWNNMNYLWWEIVDDFNIKVGLLLEECDSNVFVLHSTCEKASMSIKPEIDEELS